MMKSKRKWLFVGGAVVAIVVALALGVPASTLPLFGMRGMGDHQCGHGGARRHSDAHDAGHITEDSENRKAA